MKIKAIKYGLEVKVISETEPVNSLQINTIHNRVGQLLVSVNVSPNPVLFWKETDMLV